LAVCQPEARPQQSYPIPRSASASGSARFGLPSIHARSAATQLEESADMDIKPLGSTPSRRMGADSFTGTVWQDPIIEAPAPARIRGAWVRFEPKARTAWHTHPLGQTLHVISGVGRVQLWGGPVREIRAGDTVWIAPGEKHWHGAGPDTNMVHIALQEHLDGTHVTWLEHVTDEQYNAKIGG
jgi:quercetin dioxygenase-like cupin family protein